MFRGKDKATGAPGERAHPGRARDHKRSRDHHRRRELRVHGLAQDAEGRAHRRQGRGRGRLRLDRDDREQRQGDCADQRRVGPDRRRGARRHRGAHRDHPAQDRARVRRPEDRGHRDRARRQGRGPDHDRADGGGRAAAPRRRPRPTATRRPRRSRCPRPSRSSRPLARHDLELHELGVPQHAQLGGHARPLGREQPVQVVDADDRRAVERDDHVAFDAGPPSCAGLPSSTARTITPVSAARP